MNKAWALIPYPTLPPSLIRLMVSVEVKRHGRRRRVSTVSILQNVLLAVGIPAHCQMRLLGCFLLLFVLVLVCYFWRCHSWYNTELPSLPAQQGLGAVGRSSTTGYWESSAVRGSRDSSVVRASDS